MTLFKNTLTFMAASKKHIAPEQITEWLASTGFLFPSNEIELQRFEKLFGEPDPNLVYSINYDRILKNVFEDIDEIKKINPLGEQEPKQLKMVARNGGNVSKHILDKMIKNQQKAKGDDNGAEKKED